MRLSVIIPTHDRLALLRESIASVARLNVSPCEVIVCDDGSTEDMSMARSVFPNDDACQVIWSRTAECHGAQVARNRGLAQAQGELVLFLDSDDVLADNGIAALLRTLEANPTLHYAYGKVVQTDDKLNPLSSKSPIGSPFADAPVEIAGYHWSIMGVVYRRSYLAKVGPWNETLTGSQDWEYQARVKLAGGHGQFVDTVVGYWRQHQGGRVGAKAFRPDYVRSVMLACDSILQHARKAGRCGPALERRLAKKLIVHALEWGGNGHPNERQECLSQAADSLSHDSLLRLGIKCLACGPRSLDALLRSVLLSRTRK